MRTRRSQLKKKKGGARSAMKSMKSASKASSILRHKPVVTHQDVASMFEHEKKALSPKKEEEMEDMPSEDDAHFTDKVLEKFARFLADLEEKADVALEHEDHEERDRIDMLRVDVATRLVEAFGEKSKKEEKKAEIPDKFDDDLAELLGKMKV